MVICLITALNMITMVPLLPRLLGGQALEGELTETQVITAAATSRGGTREEWRSLEHVLVVALLSFVTSAERSILCRMRSSVVNAVSNGLWFPEK